MDAMVFWFGLVALVIIAALIAAAADVRGRLARSMPRSRVRTGSSGSSGSSSGFWGGDAGSGSGGDGCGGGGGGGDGGGGGC